MPSKMIVGNPPNLPWWRALRMSDAEIKEFNNQYLMEIEMNDDDVGKRRIDKEYDELFAKDGAKLNNVGKQFYIARIDMLIAPNWNGEKYYDKTSWNAAIEAAAIYLDKNIVSQTDGYMGDEIRKLKK